MSGSLSLCMFRILLLFATLSSVYALYSKKDNVVLLTSSNFKKTVLDSSSGVLVEFYAPWCGHCQRLAPEYTKAALKLKGLVTVAAVDCDDDTNKPLCGRYGIKGFPTIKYFGTNKNVPSDYQGPRSANSIVNYALDSMPSYVQIVGGSSKRSVDLDTFLNKDKSKVLLFSKKSSVPVLFKGLSATFKGIADFGMVPGGDSALLEKYGVESVPKIVVVKSEGEEPLRYDGQIKVDEVTRFLNAALGDGKVEGEAVEKCTRLSSLKSLRPLSCWRILVDPSVQELKSQEDLESLCLDKAGVCLVGFFNLEPEYDQSVKEHDRAVGIFRAAKKAAFDKGMPFTFVWTNAILHGRRLMADFDVSDLLPAVLAVNAKRQVYALHRGSFEEASIASFLSDLQAGRARVFPYTFKPLLDSPAARDREDL